MPNTLQDYATLPLPLTPVEAEDLHDYEATITRGLKTFYDVATAFVAIKQRKLYRAEYRTFEEYCRQKWNIDRRYADRMIEAAEVRDNLGPIGPVLEKESQARALVGLEPDQQRQVMQKAIETAPNGKITAQHIKDVRQQEIPMPEPKAAPKMVLTTNHPISVHIPPQETTTPHKPMSNPAYEEREDWTCRNCQKHFDDEFGFFYPSGRALCLECIETNDPCAACKSAHSECDGCCDQCKHPCNGAQLCRLNISAGDNDEPAEREPEEEQHQGGIWYICDFCGEAIQQAYNTYKHGNIKSSICRACTAKALTELNEEQPFGWHTQDREKICNAGLRIFRVIDTGRLELRELLPMKTNTISQRTWQLIEKFDTKAGLKRRIKDLEQDDHIIFENRL